tara:strand:- start:718 stop:924 length:207 start_codon:yes stop_codon:yes gene_type:complete
MLKSKTVWTGLAGILTALGGYFTGELELGAMMQLVLTSGLAIFLRAGVQKSTDAANAAAAAGKPEVVS